MTERARLACAVALAAFGLPACGDDTVPSPNTAASSSGTGGQTSQCAPGDVPEADGVCRPAGLPDRPCPPGEAVLMDGTCVAAGLPPGPCAPGELPIEGGGCLAAGVPASACGMGFVPDGRDGCEAVLPPAPCPAGTMAVPGETTCREVAPCDAGAWGSIPVDADTQHVDVSYAGGDGDGSPAKPWTGVQQAVDAAAPLAIVAIAAGTYAGDVVIEGKPVRLWGRCPALVEIVGSGPAAVTIGLGADGTEVRDLAVGGAQRGVGVEGAQDVSLERVWVRGTGFRGVSVSDASGPASSVTLRGALVEDTVDAGAFVAGSELSLEASVVRGCVAGGGGELATALFATLGATSGSSSTLSVVGSVLEANEAVAMGLVGAQTSIASTVVRDTSPSVADGSSGNAIVAGPGAGGVRSSVSVVASVFERNHEAAIVVRGADLDVEATVIAETLPRASDLGDGQAIVALPDSMGTATTLSVLSSVLRDGHDAAVFAAAADVTIESTVVRGTAPAPATPTSAGLFVQTGLVPTDPPSTAVVRGSVVTDNHDVGIVAIGTDLTLERTVIRRTQPSTVAGKGSGVELLSDIAGGQPGTAAIRASLIEENANGGVAVNGSVASIDQTVIRGSVPQLSGGGVGLAVRRAASGDVGRVAMRASVVEGNHFCGVYVEDAVVEIDSSVVADTQPIGGVAGRGVIVQSFRVPAAAEATLRDSVVENNHDVGVFSASADLTVDGCLVRGTTAVSTPFSGAGVSLQGDALGLGRGTIRRSVVSDNRMVGINVAGADATIEGVVVERTGSDAQKNFGRGINVGLSGDEPASAVVRYCRVEENRSSGIAVIAASATIEGTLVRGTLPREADGTHGDGVSVRSVGQSLADCSISASAIEHNARAGVASFGGEVMLTSVSLECNPIALDSEPSPPYDSHLEDLGGNVCACAGEVDVCKVLSASLEPPEPLAGAD